MEKFTIDSNILNKMDIGDYVKLLKIFEGHELYLVGGCVRDIILGRTPKDFDFCTDLTPEEMIEATERVDYTTFTIIPTGLKHGTVTFHDKFDGNSYEVTTFRTDGKYEDHRRPDEVTFTRSLEEDLKRRDLTINSLAIDVMNFGDELDVYMLDASYLYDLEYGVIRAVGDPRQRFEEDALRMLRAIRFSAQLGFTLDTDTFEAIKEKASTIKCVSHERIREELTKILMSDYPQMIELLNLTGLDEYLNLPITAMINERQHNKYHYADVFHHTMDVIKSVPKDFELRWAAFFHDWGKMSTVSVDEDGWEHYYGHPDKSADMAMAFMLDYKFDNKSIDNIYKLVKYHDSPIGANVKLKGMKKLINKLGEDLIPKFMRLTFADRLAHRLNDTRFSIENIDSGKKKLINLSINPTPMKIKDLAVNGKDLIAVGLIGKEIGDTLNYMLELVLENPELNTKDYLLSIAKDKVKEYQITSD